MKKKSAKNSSLNPHEQECFDKAVLWTAVRGLARNRTRVECGSFDEAKKIAQEFGDGRTMIYAITETGLSAHICNA